MGATIAFPAISTGAFGFPLERAANIAVRTTAETLADLTEIELATFVLFDRDSHDAFERALQPL